MDKRLEKILSFHRKHRRMPSYSEIMELTGYKSKNAVHYFLQGPLIAGILGKDKRGRLVPKKLPGIRLLGLVEAGWPSPAEEELVDTMSLDEYLIENKEATYLLRVKGDSMVDAGIQQGDLVIVERTSAAPKVGRIVIAEVDGEWTMKYLRRNTQGLYLEPANRAYKPIYPKEDLKVVAVVKGVIRKY